MKLTDEHMRASVEAIDSQIRLLEDRITKLKAARRAILGESGLEEGTSRDKRAKRLPRGAPEKLAVEALLQYGELTVRQIQEAIRESAKTEVRDSSLRRALRSLAETGKVQKTPLGWGLMSLEEYQAHFSERFTNAMTKNRAQEKQEQGEGERGTGEES